MWIWVAAFFFVVVVVVFYIIFYLSNKKTSPYVHEVVLIKFFRAPFSQNTSGYCFRKFVYFRSLKRFFSYLFVFSCCKGHFHESFKTSLLLNCYFLSSTEVSFFQCVRWRFVASYFIKADPRKFSINFVD